MKSKHPVSSLCVRFACAAALLCAGGCLLPGVESTGGNAAASLLNPPLRVTPLAATEVFPSRLNLTWAGVSGALAYELHFGQDPNPPLVTTQQATTFTVQDLEPCATYYWRVVAINDVTEVSSVTWSFETSCP